MSASAHAGVGTQWTTVANYTRQGLLQTCDLMKEVDFKGHFHPNELVRKVGREIVQRGYRIHKEDLNIQKTPVGQSTGQFSGVVHGIAGSRVNPAGQYSYLWTEGLIVSLVLAVLLFGLAVVHPALVAAPLTAIVLLVVFREKLFKREFAYGAEIKAELIVSIPGEIYEDFRREEKIPISTSASAMVARRLRAYWVYDEPKHEQIRGAGSGRNVTAPEWPREYGRWEDRLKQDLESLVEKMEAERDALL